MKKHGEVITQFSFELKKLYKIKEVKIIIFGILIIQLLVSFYLAYLNNTFAEKAENQLSQWRTRVSDDLKDSAGIPSEEWKWGSDFVICASRCINELKSKEHQINENSQYELCSLMEKIETEGKMFKYHFISDVDLSVFSNQILILNWLNEKGMTIPHSPYVPDVTNSVYKGVAYGEGVIIGILFLMLLAALFYEEFESGAQKTVFTTRLSWKSIYFGKICAAIVLIVLCFGALVAGYFASGLVFGFGSMEDPIILKNSVWPFRDFLLRLVCSILVSLVCLTSSVSVIAGIARTKTKFLFASLFLMLGGVLIALVDKATSLTNIFSLVWDSSILSWNMPLLVIECCIYFLINVCFGSFIYKKTDKA